MQVTTLGIDVAKNVFQLHGVDAQGHPVLRKRVSRSALPRFLANLAPCLIGIEACGSAHHWARRFSAMGHRVRLISPQFVRPYVKTNKNDGNDAEAICEAITRPTMRFVAMKSVEHQDIQMLHRIHERLVHSRTGAANQIRGLLAEYGAVLPKRIDVLRRELPRVLEDADNELSALARELLAERHEELAHLDKQVRAIERRIQERYRALPAAQRLGTIPGIGPLGATALVAAVADPTVFRRGRELSAWLGLVPRQYSSGERQRLLGISKRGDRYVRTLLVHGARAVLARAHVKNDPRSRWLVALKQRAGFNKACVALANKNARIAWALLRREESYRDAA